MKQTNILSAAALTLLITACARPELPQQNGWQPAETVNDFSAEGRIAVKLEGKGSYANFDWTYQNQVQTININTPLGSTVGQLCQDNQGVLAVDNKGRTYEAATAQELSNRLLDSNSLSNICTFGQAESVWPAHHTNCSRTAACNNSTGQFPAHSTATANPKPSYWKARNSLCAWHSTTSTIIPRATPKPNVPPENNHLARQP